MGAAWVWTSRAARGVGTILRQETRNLEAGTMRSARLIDSTVRGAVGGLAAAAFFTERRVTPYPSGHRGLVT